MREYVAELSCRLAKCKHTYRVVVAWKDLEVHRGQKKLSDDTRCFFYITNDWLAPAEEIVFAAHGRCNQENVIRQFRSGVRSFTAPVDNLTSNGAYMVMAWLARSLKAWAALLPPEKGRWKEKHQEEKRRLLRMDFATFRQALIQIPAQVVRTSRHIVYRLLAWNPWQHDSSPIAGDGRVYLSDNHGATFVVRAGTTFELLATNDLGERITASPAISGNELIYRTDSHLYAIGQTRKP